MLFLTPLVLQAAGVAGYFCGHEHDLQYITKLSNPTEPSSPPSWPVYVVSGGGSDVRSEEFIKYQPTVSTILLHHHLAGCVHGQAAAAAACAFMCAVCMGLAEISHSYSCR